MNYVIFVSLVSSLAYPNSLGIKGYVVVVDELGDLLMLR